MRVEVFKTDIKEACQKDCRSCVVAKALDRHVPEGYGVRVWDKDYDVVQLDRDGTVQRTVKYNLTLSRHVRRYIKRFDTNKHSVCPTVLNIDIPELPAL